MSEQSTLSQGPGLGHARFIRLPDLSASTGLLKFLILLGLAPAIMTSLSAAAATAE
ncbi:MAG: hypothetical protein AAF942_06440 [Pseudomonadota bacterium]